MLRSWSRGNYFRVGGENQINIEWNYKCFSSQTLKDFSLNMEIYLTEVCIFLNTYNEL